MDGFLNIELFTSVQEAKLLAEQHRIKYNTYRERTALQGRTPLEVLHQWKAARVPTSSKKNWTSKGGDVTRSRCREPGVAWSPLGSTLPARFGVRFNLSRTPDIELTRNARTKANS